jgi:beta-xylosidase
VQLLPTGTQQSLLAELTSPIIFRGDASTAYRDPAAIYHDGWFYLYLSINKVEANDKRFQYTAWSKSRDLLHWTEPRIFTPRDQSLNYSSPGDVIRLGKDWILCLQTYPRAHGERYGDESARIWIMRSPDLENWGPAEALAVKGPDVPLEKMGRMIDPYLFQDKDVPGKWWCFFKQNGLSCSWSRDLKHWLWPEDRPIAPGVIK